MLTIQDLAARLDALIPLHLALAEHAGRWTADDPDPAQRARWAALSAQQSAHVDAWSARYPDHVPGLEPGPTPATIRDLVDRLATVDPSGRAALVRDVVLPALAERVDEIGASTDDALDAPTARIARTVSRDLVDAADLI